MTQQDVQAQAAKFLGQMAGYVGVRTIQIGLSSGLLEEVSRHADGTTARARRPHGLRRALRRGLVQGGVRQRDPGRRRGRDLPPRPARRPAPSQCGLPRLHRRDPGAAGRTGDVRPVRAAARKRTAHLVGRGQPRVHPRGQRHREAVLHAPDPRRAEPDTRADRQAGGRRDLPACIDALRYSIEIRAYLLDLAILDQHIPGMQLIAEAIEYESSGQEEAFGAGHCFRLRALSLLRAQHRVITCWSATANSRRSPSG